VPVCSPCSARTDVRCAGGALALTDCLNFGNPEKPAIGWELEQAIDGTLGRPTLLASRRLGQRVLYNDTDGRSIPPTPVVGCVGLVPDVRFLPGAWRSGDIVLVATAPGDLDLDAEAALVRFVWKAGPVLTLATDVSDGGLTEALREAEEHSGSARTSNCRRRRPAARSSSRVRLTTSSGSAQRVAANRRGALMCGLFGIRSPSRDVARLTYIGLFALQHRGQESAGIAVSDEGGQARRDMGLVTQVFTSRKLRDCAVTCDRAHPLLDNGRRKVETRSRSFSMAARARSPSAQRHVTNAASSGRSSANWDTVLPLRRTPR